MASEPGRTKPEKAHRRLRRLKRMIERTERVMEEDKDKWDERRKMHMRRELSLYKWALAELEGLYGDTDEWWEKKGIR